MCYCDLKDENVLIDESGLLRLTDLGAVGTPEELREYKMSFHCTPFFAAPELFDRDEAKRSVACEWWSLGVLGFMMLEGKNLFDAENLKELKNLIRYSYIFYPQSFSIDAKEMLTELLQRQPLERCGTHNQDQLKRFKQLSFFENVDWEKMRKRDLQAPIFFPEEFYHNH